MAGAEKVYRAAHRWARIAPRKARLVASMVRGLPVNDAIAVLDNHPRRASALLSKVVKSALSNASQEADVDLNDATIDLGAEGSGGEGANDPGRGVDGIAAETLDVDSNDK